MWHASKYSPLLEAQALKCLQGLESRLEELATEPGTGGLGVLVLLDIHSRPVLLVLAIAEDELLD